MINGNPSVSKEKFSGDVGDVESLFVAKILIGVIYVTFLLISVFKFITKLISMCQKLLEFKFQIDGTYFFNRKNRMYRSGTH